MPFSRPTKSELQDQALADIAAELKGADPLLPVSNLRVLGRVLGEGMNAEYGYLDYIARQGVPFTAVDEAFEGWAALKNQQRKPATAASGSGTWSGTPGKVIPAGAQVVRGDGWTYVTIADATVAGGGAVTAQLLALTPGAAGTLVTGSPLTLSNAIAGIASVGAATAGSAGADLEDFAAFRARVLAIYAAPPQGGSETDYVTWALSASIVTRAWAVRNGRGAGTVIVYVMMDVSEAGNGGFPQGNGGVATQEPRDTAASGDLLTVANVIWPLQPVTALVYALAPQQNTVTFSITLAGASTDLKAQVAAAIAQTFLTYGAPGGVIQLSDIEAAITQIPAARGFVITAAAANHGSVSPGSDGNITSNAGYLPVLGAITWTT